MSRGTPIWLEGLSFEMKLIENSLPYEIKNINGQETIIIQETAIRNKRVFNRIVADFYNEQKKYDKSGFSDFLARSYAGEIRNAN